MDEKQYDFDTDSHTSWKNQTPPPKYQTLNKKLSTRPKQDQQS